MWAEGIFFNVYLGQMHICLCLDLNMHKGKLKQRTQPQGFPIIKAPMEPTSGWTRMYQQKSLYLPTL